MPRPRTEGRWVRRIRELTVNNSKLSAAAIRRKLQQEAKNGEKPPSPRTIARIIQEFDLLPADAKLPYRYFSWPESFLDGALPWEASRAVLDLLRLRVQLGMDPPLVSEAQWFYRISIAAGVVNAESERADLVWKAQHATYLAFLEMAGDAAGVSEHLTGFQWLLAFQPWRSREHDEAYQSAIHEKKIPAPSDAPPVVVPAEKMVALAGSMRTGSDVVWRFLSEKKKSRKPKGGE